MSHAPYGGEADLQYVTFLRDPVSRVISMWRFMRMRPHKSHIYGPISEIHTPIEYYKTDYHPNIKNAQTAMVAGIDNSKEPVTQKHLDMAKRNLEKFFFVGYTIAWEQSIKCLSELLGWSEYPKLKVANASLKEDHNMCIAQLEELHELEKYDVELLAFSRELTDE